MRRTTRGRGADRPQAPRPEGQDCGGPSVDLLHRCGVGPDPPACRRSRQDDLALPDRLCDGGGGSHGEGRGHGRVAGGRGGACAGRGAAAGIAQWRARPGRRVCRATGRLRSRRRWRRSCSTRCCWTWRAGASGTGAGCASGRPFRERACGGDCGRGRPQGGGTRSCALSAGSTARSPGPFCGLYDTVEL